jgi:hypothetical protein
MALLLPGIQVILRRSTSAPNPQDLSAIPCVIGPCSAGPINEVTTLTTVSDLAQFGHGPGVEHAADILNVAGGPVYFVRPTTTTPSTLSSVTKTLGNPVGTPVTAFGSVLVPGGTATGDVLVTAKQAAVTLQVLNPGVVTAATLVNVTGTAIVVTLKHDGTNITETGTGLAAAINGSVPAFALVGAAAQGGGAGTAGALATAALDDGAINFTALQTGVSFEILWSGVNTVFATAYNVGLKKVTVTLATDANGRPTTTATQALTLAAGLNNLASANPGVFVATAVAAGGKLLAAKALTALPFGSNGTASVAGTPADQYGFVVEVIRAGTVGGANPVGIKWTCDNIAYTSEVLVPNSGIVQLKDQYIDTGVTITLTGTFDVGDKFTFTSTLPTTGSTDMLTALDVAIADTTRKWGFITFSGSVNRALATSIDAKLQAALQSRFFYSLLNTRDQAEGVPSETEAQWMTSVSVDFAGFQSAKGIEAICAGAVSHLSTYTGRTFRRPLVFVASARCANIPVHEDLGKTLSGTLRNVLGIYHDESKHYGLEPQRFITTRTFDTRPGEFYIASAPTMSDPSDTAYTLLEYTKLALSVARIAKETAFPLINDSLQGIPIPDSTGAPAGALAFSEAKNIEDFISAAVKGFLFKIKTDGKVSASLQEKYVTVLRNYSYLATRELRMEITFTPLGLTRTITIGINLNIPA